MFTRLSRVQWAGLLLLVGGVTFLMVLHLAETTFPGYSVSLNWISDLGQSCSYAGTNWPHDCVYVQPAATIFTAGAVLFGGLLLAGAYLLFPFRRPRRLALFLGLAGAGAVGLALFPEGVPLGHAAAAGAALFGGALAALESFRFVPRPLGYLFLVLGSVSLVAFGIVVTVGGGTGAPTWTPLGKGGMERMAVYPELLWDIAFGATLMSQPDWLAEPTRPMAVPDTQASGAASEPTVRGRSAKPPV